MYLFTTKKQFLADRPCRCPLIIDPVCGRNGRTYDNSCLARCRGGTGVACMGRCPCRRTQAMKDRLGGGEGGGGGQPESALADPIYTKYCMMKTFTLTDNVHVSKDIFLQPALLVTFVRLATPATRCSATVTAHEKRPSK